MYATGKRDVKAEENEVEHKSNLSVVTSKIGNSLDV